MLGTGRLVRVWVRVRVRVRYRYGTGTVRVRYMGTVGTVHGYENRTHVPYPCTVPTVPVPCTQIAAEIVADLLLFLPLFGYMVRISAAIWVHGTGTVGTVHGTKTVPMYRTDRTSTHVSYPYRTRTVPVPYPHPYPHPNPYQPSRTHLNSSARPLRTIRHEPNRKQGFHCSWN